MAVPCAVARVTQPGAKRSLGQAGAPRGWRVAGTSQGILWGAASGNGELGHGQACGKGTMGLHGLAVMGTHLNPLCN